MTGVLQLEKIRTQTQTQRENHVKMKPVLSDTLIMNFWSLELRENVHCEVIQSAVFVIAALADWYDIT